MRGNFSAGTGWALLLVAWLPACGSEASVAGFQALPGAADGAGGGVDNTAQSGTGTTSNASSGATGAGGSSATGGEGAGTEPFSCSDKDPASGSDLVSIDSGGLPRTAIVHLPPSYDPAAGTMVVLNFHGFSSTALQQGLLSDMSETADERGFIAVYPYGVANSWNAGQCCGTAWTDSVDDVAYTDALLDELEARYCVDPSRIYATGMSNGGFFAHRLACELSERIAAIAPVAGTLGVDDCSPTRQVPVMHFHGTEDPLVPYEGGLPLTGWNVQGDLDFTSVDETIDFWRDANGCSASASDHFLQGDSTCIAWSSGGDDAAVVRCVVDGGGHTWPGGLPIPFLGKTTTDMDASALMVDFFEDNPLP